jgi:hypothetical protein
MSMEPTPSAAPASGFPLNYDVQYPEKLNRWLNNPFLIWIKWIFAIPHLAILYALGAVANIIVIIAFFAILFTKKYPKGLHDIVANYLRWQSNVYAYLFMLRDEYPPFSWDAGKYPVTFETTYEPEMGRFAPIYKWILVIPNVLVLFLLAIVAIVVWLIAGFAILFTGKFPRGMFDFLVGVGRWSHRANMYAFLLMTDKYPPFGTKP